MSNQPYPQSSYVRGPKPSKPYPAFLSQSGQRKLGDVATAIIVVIAVVGVLIGIMLATHSEPDPIGYGPRLHPHVVQGLILIAASLVQTVFSLLFVRTCSAIGEIRDHLVRP